MARPVAAACLALMFLLAGCSDDSPTTSTDPGTDGASGGDSSDGSSGGGGGGGDAGSSDPPGDGEVNATVQNLATITISATGIYPVNPALDPARVEVDAGALLELTFVNSDQNPLASHNWLLEATGDVTETIDPGETTVLQLRVPSEPGEYTFYCDLGDHRERGMEGILIVV